MPTPPRSRAQLARENRALQARLAEAERALAALRSSEQGAGDALPSNAIDIAARKHADATILRLAERLDLATRAAHMGVWDWDIQKNELVWDDRMYELYGVRRENFVGAYEAWLKGLHPDDRAASDAISAQARRGECAYDTEFRVVWPDGSIHVMKASGDVFREDDGTPLRMIGDNYDITARKNAEHAAHELLLRLQKLAAQIPGMIFQYKLRMDGSTCFPYVSPGIRTIYGIAPDAVREDAAPILQMRHPDDAEAMTDSIQESARTLTPWRHEYRIQLPDGTERWLYGDANPERDADGGTLWHGFLTDITARKQAEAALQHAMEALTGANANLERQTDELQVGAARLRAVLHEKDVLLKEIHHRVKNNLQVVISLLRLQSRHVTDAQAVEVLRNSRQRVEVMALVHELLYRTEDMAAIDATRYFQQLGTQLTQIYAVTADQITLSVAAEGIWLSLNQAVPCGMIVSELLANSLKYAFPNGQHGEIGIALRATSLAMLTLTVWDTGIGFASSADVVRPPSLGMTLVHDLVQQLHGTTVIAHGAGVTVTISFPIDAVLAQATTAS
ncbi:MAG: PAS domain-containing protein [Chloroflexales bacterium]